MIAGEAIQNASGLGLRFVNGNPQWDLTTNVYMMKVEVSAMQHSFKDTIPFTLVALQKHNWCQCDKR